MTLAHLTPLYSPIGVVATDRPGKDYLLPCGTQASALFESLASGMDKAARPLIIGAVRTLGLRSALASVHQRLEVAGIAARPDASISQSPADLWRALLDRSIDLGLTDIADWPLHLPFGVALAAVSGRLDPLDVLLTRPPGTLDTLPAGATVYVYRASRSAQLRRYRPDFRIVPEAGPPGHRILERAPDAVVFPARAVGRLDPAKWNIGRLGPEVILPPPLQGIFVVAMREGEPALLRSIRDALHEPAIAAAAAAEAGFRSALAADLASPVAALATCADEGHGGAAWMDLAVRILSPDGSRLLEGVTSERVESEQHGRDLGAALALDLVGQGALDLLDLSRGESS